MSRHRRQASRVILPELMSFDSPPSDNPCFLIDQITAVDEKHNSNRQSAPPPYSPPDHRRQNAGPPNAPPSDGGGVSNKSPGKSTA
ncbi:hypothetical protein SOVF_009310 [Spinacia oleracea]|nr:hypothetical protein SOVF_009310 [Spinacia oleracea]